MTQFLIEEAGFLLLEQLETMALTPSVVSEDAERTARLTEMARNVTRQR